LKHFYNYFFAWVSIRGDFRGLNENSYAVVAEMERGALRSGERFAARNQSYYPSVQELLSHHQRLLAEEPAITTRAVRIAGLSVGSLLQTTVRFRFDSSIIQPTLRRIFSTFFANTCWKLSLALKLLSPLTLFCLTLPVLPSPCFTATIIEPLT